MVEGARFFCSRKNRYRRTTVRLKAKRGSEQYQTMNSSMACAYDSCELTAASEFRTAFFDCSRSGSRSIVLDLERFDFFRCAILAASHAAASMVVQLEADGFEPRFWPTSGLPTTHPRSRLARRTVYAESKTRLSGGLRGTAPLFLSRHNRLEIAWFNREILALYSTIQFNLLNGNLSNPSPVAICDCPARKPNPIYTEPFLNPHLAL